MENVLETFDKSYLDGYMCRNNFCGHEWLIFNEMRSAVVGGDMQKLEWFKQFGSEIRQILFNVHAYRKGLVFVRLL